MNFTTIKKTTTKAKTSIDFLEDTFGFEPFTRKDYEDELDKVANRWYGRHGEHFTIETLIKYDIIKVVKVETFKRVEVDRWDEFIMDNDRNKIIANELWEAMPLEVRKAHNDKLKKRFEEKNINNKRAEFRPKHEYIRSITGLDLTNRSISRYLSEDRVKALIEAQDPEVEQEPKPTLEKPKKNRKVRSLNQMLEATAIEFSYFMSAESEETLDENTTAIINSINELILSLLRSRNN